jgi:hypothetical protein
MRTVGSSILKLKAELGNISPAAIWQAKSYIELLTDFAAVGYAKEAVHCRTETLCPLNAESDFGNGANRLGKEALRH